MPGRYRCGFLTAPGAAARAAFVASCFLGDLPPVNFRAVCFVQAMLVGGGALRGKPGSGGGGGGGGGGEPRRIFVLFLILGLPVALPCPLITPAGSLALRKRAFKRGGLCAPDRNLVVKSKLGDDTMALSLLIDKDFTGYISLSADNKMRPCS